MPTKQISLHIDSATHVIGVDDTYLVFPAIDFESKKDKAPKRNLNTADASPPVMRIEVHAISQDEGRRDAFGYSGPERLFLFLTPAAFDNLAKRAGDLENAPIDLTLDLDEQGEVHNLAVDGIHIRIPINSGTVPVGDNTASRTGTDK